MAQDQETEPEKENQKIRPKSSRGLWCCLAVIAVLFALGTWQSIRSYYWVTADRNDGVVPTPKPPAAPPKTDEPKPAPSPEPKPKPQPEPEPEPEPAPDEAALRKAKLIDFFIETAVSDDTNKSHEVRLVRWTLKDVSVGVAEGKLDEHTDGCLNSFISDFNSLSNSIKLNRNDKVDLGIPKIKIYYWPEDKYNGSWTGKVNEYAFEQGIFNDDGSFKRAQIFISGKIASMNEAVGCQLIRHEMMHAVGFWGHSTTIFFESIMSQPKTRYLYPEEDKYIVKMLYNLGVPLGSSASATRSFLEKNFSP